MAADTYTFTMKKLDRAKWQQVKGKAATEGLTLRGLLEKLTEDYLHPERREDSRYD